MNITVYTSTDFPSGGAPENFVRQMTIGLHECCAGIRVVRIRGRYYGGANHTNICCSNLLFRKRPQNEILKVLELFSIIFFSPFSLIINKYRYKTDAVILYAIEYSYYIIPFIITSKLFKIKIFRIITDYYETKSIVPVWWKRPKVFFYERQFQHIDKFFNGIVVLSEYLKDNAIRYGVKANRIILIPHFIDIASFVSENKSASKVNLKLIIGFCGGPIISNGILDLIEAFQIVKQKYDNIELLIIGNPTDDVKSFIAEIAMNSYDQDITYTGFLQKEDVKLQLNRCSILTNPRKSGRLAEAGFPTKLGEYFATAKPVVSTKTGDIKKYFTDKKELVLVEPDSPQALADGIEFLIKNKAEAIKIGLNGYKWAKANLDYLANANKLLSFIRNL